MSQKEDWQSIISSPFLSGMSLSVSVPRSLSAAGKRLITVGGGKEGKKEGPRSFPPVALGVQLYVAKYPSPGAEEEEQAEMGRKREAIWWWLVTDE